MNAKEVFDKFSHKKVLVIGDVMIDAYLRGRVERISPEAPVPIIHLKKTEERLGGAANVALNIQALGAEAILCSVIGKDNNSDKFIELMHANQLSTEGIVQTLDRRTTVKTRVIGNNQHLLRIDDEEVSALTTNQEDQFLASVKRNVDKGIDAIILEDYNKGLLTKRVIREVIEMANAKQIVIAVDPKKENFFEYKNVTLFKPNLKELKEGLNVEFDIKTNKKAFEDSILKMEEKLNNQMSFVTLSEHGVFIKEGNSTSYLAAHVRDISDVSGAGDTVISVATLCLSIGLPAVKIAAIANLAGGMVCEQSGVVPIDRTELMIEVEKL